MEVCQHLWASWLLQNNGDDDDKSGAMVNLLKRCDGNVTWRGNIVLRFVALIDCETVKICTNPTL